ncbi:MAG: ATP synthase F1 subunit gamma [Defluviitaleaceae bacterium]|nr:ATP synthase F1 subunit gamma [Defluviitaleaceae bacterium]
MPSMIDIKRRMKSIKGTGQMTKAMNLVASSKLSRAKNRLSSSLPFFVASNRLLSYAIHTEEGAKHPFVYTEKIDETNLKTEKIILIAIAGDRGLCGGYNANLIKEAGRLASVGDVSVFTVGKKCTEFFKRTGLPILGNMLGISEEPTYEDAKKIALEIINAYNQEPARVVLVYTFFESIMSFLPQSANILPLSREDFKIQPNSSLITYEPSIEIVMNELVERYIAAEIYDALLESAECEQAARMTSMDAATKNAKDALEGMSLIYNRARQAAITQEISEIVGGASALSSS